jgi:hypothetical protein
MLNPRKSAQSLNFTNNPITLTFDRTNWKFGKRNINYFVLAICYRTVAIPVLLLRDILFGPALRQADWST